ncbi:MAG: type II toxin-antitoxin system VapC family toxin [Eubacteriaceae bacterium]|nr:type II toxin-antitoxin system VapC family toxin [Eubacteriaceae bacterium]
MKCLLDTHMVLWLAENSPKLSNTAKAIILDETNEKYVSIASCWEVSIKLSLNKLDLAGGTHEFFRIIRENGLLILQVEEGYLAFLETLPFHHRDPFDRLIIATAISEGLALLTDDSQIVGYAGAGLQIVS